MSLISRTRLAAAAVLLGTLGAGVGSAGEAEGQRRHAAHVHGVGKLEVVLEGATLHIAAHSPAANIVGFEHAPADDTARAAVAKAHRTLLEATRLFRLPERAGCRVDQASVRLPWPDHTRETADHAAHDRASAHGGHTDIEAEYHFVCARPEAIDSLRVDLFDAFPTTERLDARFVLERSQGAATLTPGNRTLRF